MNFLKAAALTRKFTIDMTRKLLLPASVIPLLTAGCGIYTFSGSTLPGHLKTVEIPLFTNQSLHPEIAEEITTKLNREILTSNLMRIVSENGDAAISGKVTSYNHHPYTYGSENYRDVTVTQYAVTINVEVEFYDNVKKEAMFKGPVSAQGIYDLSNENEQAGIQRAIDKLIEQILQNSLRNW